MAIIPNSEVICLEKPSVGTPIDAAMALEWACTRDQSLWSFKGILADQLISPTVRFHLKGLGMSFSDDTLELISKVVARIPEDPSASAPQNLWLTALDGRQYLFKGYALSQTANSLADKTEFSLGGLLIDLSDEDDVPHGLLRGRSRSLRSRKMQSVSETPPVTIDDASLSTASIDADYDDLTQILNRSGFIREAQHYLKAPGDYDLVVGDISRFHKLNEALGLERADLVLSVLGLRLSEAFGDKAIVARLGEDEFCALTVRDFPRTSERFLQAMERPISIAGFDFQPAFSIGVVPVTGGSEDLNIPEMLRRAQIAVNESRQMGVGKVAAYRRDLECDGLTRLALEADLRRAFVSGEIEAHYQPVIDLSTGAISGFEALARWQHPRRGLVPPDQFLGAAYDLGLMNDLGKIMMSKAAHKLSWFFKNHAIQDHFFISVNMSAGEIGRAFLLEDVRRLIREFDLPPKSLKFEITESDAMNDPQATALILTDLSKAGAAIALDDFGTGFSSLSYLAKLPSDTLKIDRSFIKTMKTDEASGKIVRAIINLGRDLNQQVIAEGVEDLASAMVLSSMGASHAQGYYYAKPMTPHDTDAFLGRALEMN